MQRRPVDIGPFQRRLSTGGRWTYTITCGGCGETEDLQNQNMGPSTAAEMLPVKFRDRGWKVSHSQRGHRCRSCQKTNRRESVMTGNGSSNVTPIIQRAEEPIAATVEDRRVINEKLLDVYADKGYIKDWSDEKVAKDLGVPRAWVEQVRDFSFGPNVNENDMAVNLAIEAAIVEARKLHEDAKADHLRMTREMDAHLARVALKVNEITRLAENLKAKR